MRHAPRDVGTWSCDAISTNEATVMTARSPMNDGRPTALTSWLTASGDPGSRPRGRQSRAAADLPDDRAVTPVGFDLVEDDPWTGWPSTTPDQDGDAPERRRILVPYCGTRTAEAALETAADWCHALAAEAWVLYVRPWDPVRGGRIFLETPAEARGDAGRGGPAARRWGVRQRRGPERQPRADLRHDRRRGRGVGRVRDRDGHPRQARAE